MALRTILITALISTALYTPVLAANNGDIKSVTISSGGLSEIVRKARVEDDGAISIEIPLKQVDDILKSLVVNDEKGSVKDISLAGPQPIAETFEGLPFASDNLGNIPSLIAKLQGVKATVTSGEKSLTGIITGVELRTAKDAVSAYKASLFTDKGIESLDITENVQLQILDEAMRSKLESAISVVGKAVNDGSRLISIRMNGATSRDVTLTYVVASPIWKTSYRLLIDDTSKARLQAWAILENASGEDWKDVEITLTSGEPVTLKQKLHERIWKDREEVASGNAVRPRSMKASRGGEVAAFAAPVAPMSMDASASMERSFEMATAMAGDAIETDVVTKFTLPGSFNLPKGETLATPIADQTIEAEIVSLYKPQSHGQHPVTSVSMKNTTSSSLPPGIMTVFTATEGYVGDSKVEGIHKDDVVSASFAVDKKVSISQSTKHDQAIMSVKVVDGMLSSETKMRETTAYEITGAADADRTVVIEEPKQPGTVFKSEAFDRETASAHLLRAKVAKGGKVTVSATHETMMQQTYGLAELAPNTLIELSVTSIDEAVAEKLKALAKSRSDQVEAEIALQRVDEGINALEKSQDRIRKNLEAVPDGSDLQTSYVNDLSETEKSIKGLEVERQQAKSTLDKFASKVRDQIRTF